MGSINGVLDRLVVLTLSPMQVSKMSALKYALSLLALLVVSAWAEVTTLHVSHRC